MSVKSLDTVINLEKLEDERNNQNGELIKTRLRIKSGSNDRLFKTLSKCEDYNGVITISELEKDIRDSSKSTKVSLYPCSVQVRLLRFENGLPGSGLPESESGLHGLGLSGPGLTFA